MTRRTFALVAVASALALSVSCLSTAGHRQFESEHVLGKLTSGIPPGWKLRGPIAAALPEGIDVYLDALAPHGGQLCATLVATDAVRNDYATLEQDFLADGYRGKRVRFSGYLRTNRVYGWAGLLMRVDGEKHQNIAGDIMDDREITGTTEWTRYSVVLDVDPSAVVISVGFSLHGEGQAWLDDCAFEVVDESVPSTDQFPESYRRRVVISPTLYPEPDNLDFESDMFGS